MNKRLDHNINSPLVINELDPYPRNLPGIKFLLQEEYDLIAIKDPLIVYIITDSIDHRYYIGELEVCNYDPKRMYLLGASDTFGEYTLYLNINFGENKGEKLIEICKYKNIQQAVNALNQFQNNIGSHTEIEVQLYDILLRYIQREIGINDTMISIISLLGYKDDIRLQELIEYVYSFDKNRNTIEIPNSLRNYLSIMDSNPNILFKYYSNLYDIFIMYNFFKDKKYQTKKEDKINLSDVIKRILTCIK